MNSKKKTDDQCYEHFLWDIPEQSISDGKILFIAQSICNKYKQTQETTCSAIFYPYSDLKNTIRIDNSLIKIRISDILRTAPETIIEYLIEMLLARALRKKPQQHWVEQFNQYIHSPEVEAQYALIKGARKRKQLTSPKGRHYDLQESFDRVNQKYFEGKLQQPKLSWSPKRSRRQLGYHEASLNLIVISRNLDRKNVPEFMVDYIMYHELLHTVIRPTNKNGRRIVHSKEFKQQEQKFEQYNDALHWLKTSS
jgi:predicted metal-dependent hydrolase